LVGEGTGKMGKQNFFAPKQSGNNLIGKIVVPPFFCYFWAGWGQLVCIFWGTEKKGARG